MEGVESQGLAFAGFIELPGPKEVKGHICVIEIKPLYCLE